MDELPIDSIGKNIYREKIAQLTLDEKFRLLTGTGMNTSLDLKEKGIRQMRFHDGPFGVRMPIRANEEKQEFAEKMRSAFPNSEKCEEVVSTAFPTGCALSAAWDSELMEQVGEALGEEFLAYGINAVMGPSVNIKRHPLCGRNFEYLSEDPYLAGKLGAGYVRGVQRAGASACPKHFIANNQERGRFSVSSEMDDRTMREIYLKPFEIIVKEAHPWSLMCAYNRINGVYASEHKQLLQEILRDEWGFDGIIVSDWGSVKHRAYSLLASVELCMPYQEEAYEQLEKSYEAGQIDMEVIDAALERMLLFQDRTKAAWESREIDFAKHDEIALRAARESMTLLKNENHALPIRPGQIRRLLVVGEPARSPFIGGDGSSRVNNPPRIASPLEELRAILGNETEIDFMGQDEIGTFVNEVGHMETDLYRRAQNADAVVVFLSQDYSENSETMDRNHMEIEPYYEHVLRVCDRVNSRVIAVLNIGGAVITGHWQHYVDAILVSWLGGQEMGRAVAETLCGQNNPAGRLAETFPKRQQDVLSLQNYPGDGYKTVYREGLMVGYRHFDTNGIDPEYEFGFGLSYSEFSYGNLKREGLTLQFEVENTSETDGDEIVQVYLSAPADSWVSHPEKELKAFRRISLRAGEKKQVEISLKKEDFQYYNSALRTWTVETGTYVARIGSSSRNLPLRCEIPMEDDALLTSWGSPE